MQFSEVMAKGGLAMWPLLLLSILSLGTILERLFFWWQVLGQGKQIHRQILMAAEQNWPGAAAIARNFLKHPLGRFLYNPLLLEEPEPEILHLALETAAEEEYAQMRKGEKLLEAVIALSPLLGLLGTVLGLINSLSSIQISDLGTDSTAGVSLGIGESLISTASGLIVAIFSLAFYRLFQGFCLNQLRLLRKVGSQLEMIYREKWLLDDPE